MTTITAVTIGGAAVNLEAVSYDVTISHGRSTITDGPTASTAQIVLTGYGLPDVDLSDTVAISAYGQARFTGLVSDLEPAQDRITGRQFLTVSCTGLLADLALLPVTPSAWPLETSGARAARILTAAGVTSYDTSGDLSVLASTADPTNALDLLGTLATDTGAAVVDTPTGAVLFQDLLARAQSYIANVWSTTTGTWSASSGAWADQVSPSVADPVELPADAIAWTPSLQQHRGDIVNRVTVVYGSPQAEITEDDTASQAIHKIRAASITTALATSTDATTRGENIIMRQAQPRYQMGGVSILVHELDTTTRGKALGLLCGSRAIVKGLPGIFPEPDYLGVVEGWSENYTVDNYGNESHVLNLALSDPLASYATVQWGQITGTRTWANINTTTIWADVTVDADLAA